MEQTKETLELLIGVANVLNDAGIPVHVSSGDDIVPCLVVGESTWVGGRIYYLPPVADNAPNYPCLTFFTGGKPNGTWTHTKQFWDIKNPSFKFDSIVEYIKQHIKGKK